MSLSMFMEVERGASLSHIEAALSSLGVTFEDRSKVLSGFFEESNCHFVFKYDDMPDVLVVEGLKVEWRVGLRGAFHYRASNLHSSWTDIVRFLNLYSSSQSCEFVLSFHYETVYAIRDKGGLKFVGPLGNKGELID